MLRKKYNRLAVETGDSQVGADVLYSLDRAVLVQHTSCMHVAAALRLVAYVFGDILAGLEVGELHLYVTLSQCAHLWCCHTTQ